MNLKQFDNALRHHDWFYYYSDDSRVYRAGRERFQLLEDISRQSDNHRELFETWCGYINGGEEQSVAEAKRDEVRRRLCGSLE